ncbi:MAG: exodeoxyribonuclease VII small subunit [Clostridiales bacterium]|nr:exodeoxyribonuclease VII small subunit [Clostridiales bacterium]
MKEKTFTEAFTNLQEAVSKIGLQSTTLEESLKLFDQGMKEAEFCKNILDNADQHIIIYEKGV